MDFKHSAGPQGLAGHRQPCAPVPCGVPRTATSGPSLPQLPLPRTALQAAVPGMCLPSLASRLPPQVLVARPVPVTPVVLPRLEQAQLLPVLAKMFGKPCPDLQPDTLYALALARATGLDASGADEFIERIIIGCSRCLGRTSLAAVVAGLASALPDDAARQRCRDRLLQCLASPSRGEPCPDIARLAAATSFAWGGGNMYPPDLDAFMRLLQRAPGDVGPAQVCEIIKGLCAGLGGSSMDLVIVQELVLSLCEGVDALEDPLQARRLMRQVADSLGGKAITEAMRGFLLDLLVDDPPLDLEQMGHMLLGLADSLDASPAPAARDLKADAKAAASCGTQPGLPNLTFITGPAAALGLPQLVHWGTSVAVAVRAEGAAGIESLRRALDEAAIFFDPRQLTALGCGLAAGLGDGLLGEATRATLMRLPGVVSLEQQRALALGLELAQDPLRATEGHEDQLELLELAWLLPNVLNARTAPLWFSQVHDGKAPAGERVHTLALLVRQGARHLPPGSLRQARDLALAHEASQLALSIQGAWMERGLPEALFDPDLPWPADLPIYRVALAQRLAEAQEELNLLREAPCEPAVRLRLSADLRKSVTCLRRGLEAAREQAATQLSAPAIR